MGNDVAKEHVFFFLPLVIFKSGILKMAFIFAVYISMIIDMINDHDHAGSRVEC